MEAKEHITISVALAVLNEEANIGRCLRSVAGFADEIVVVDGGSHDNTVNIAKSFRAKIFQTDNPPIFHINKQKAVDACTSEWILQLDADEEVTQELAHEIVSVVGMTDADIDLRIIPPEKKRLFDRHEALVRPFGGNSSQRDSITAFYLPRKNEFLGHVISHAGTYPDGVVRLFRRGKGRFPAKSVHEQIEVDGRIAWLVSDLIHHSNPTLAKYISGARRYTDRVAEDLRRNAASNSGVSGVSYMVILPVRTFFILYVRHKGFLDGMWGFLFCFFSSLHYPVAYIKSLIHKK